MSQKQIDDFSEGVAVNILRYCRIINGRGVNVRKYFHYYFSSDRYNFLCLIKFHYPDFAVAILKSITQQNLCLNGCVTTVE